MGYEKTLVGLLKDILLMMTSSKALAMPLSNV